MRISPIWNESSESELDRIYFRLKNYKDKNSVHASVVDKPDYYNILLNSLSLLNYYY